MRVCYAANCNREGRHEITFKWQKPKHDTVHVYCGSCVDMFPPGVHGRLTIENPNYRGQSVTTTSRDTWEIKPNGR